MNKEVEAYYDKPLFGELLTITKTGIVNTCQILVDAEHEQLVHNGKLYYKWYTSLACGGEDQVEVSDIEKYNAVYYNGIQIVRKGKVFIGSGI